MNSSLSHQSSDFHIHGLDHVQLAMPRGLEDVARSFYSGVLGLREVAKPENLAKRGGVWFENGPLKVHLGVEQDFRPARKAHPALLVLGLKGLATYLEAAGVTIVRDEPLESYDRIHVSDPFGNRLELLEPITGEFVPQIFDINDRHQLRLRSAADADELFHLIDGNRTYLRAWLPWVDRSRCVDDTRKSIEAGARQLAGRQGFQAAICEDGAIAGMIGFHSIDWQNGSTSIGYWLAESHQGRGLVTASCQALVEHAFNVWNLNRIVIRCATGNRRSQAIPERLGFTREGVLRESEWLYDHYVDLINYSLLREDRERMMAERNSSDG